jgi:small subunit ribosomal protein S17
VHHIVNSILAPFGEPIEARPPVPTAGERIAEREAKKKMKELRRKAERRGASVVSKREEGILEVRVEAIQEVKAELDVKGDEEVQARSSKGTEESVVSEGTETAQEVKEEVKEEEQVPKSKGWWRL